MSASPPLKYFMEYSVLRKLFKTIPSVCITGIGKTWWNKLMDAQLLQKGHYSSAVMISHKGGGGGDK